MRARKIGLTALRRAIGVTVAAGASAWLAWLALSWATGGRDARDGLPPDPGFDAAPREELESAARIEHRGTLSAPGADVALQAQAEPGGGFDVVAVGPDGSRATALVSVESAGASRVLGTTSLHEPLRIAAEAVEYPARFIALAEGPPSLVGQVLVEHEPRAATLELRLDSSCRLQGTVVDEEGLPVGAGVRVIALTPDRRARWLDESSFGAPVPDGRWAETATRPDGSFELTGLLPDRIYSLHAAGRGLVTDTEGTLERHACGAEAVLKVLPLYGGILRYDPPEVDRMVREVYAILFGVATLGGWPEGTFPLHLAGEPALAGTPLAKQAREATAEGLRVVSLTSAARPAFLTARLQLRVPFLPHAWHDVRVPRMSDQLPDILFQVPELEGPLGALTVVGFAPVGALDMLPPDQEVGRLKLERDGRVTEVIVRAEALLLGIHVPGLPLGAYEWSLQQTGAGRLLPQPGDASGPVIVEDDGATLVLDLTWTAAAQIEIVDAAGIPFEGYAQASFGNLSGAAFRDKEGNRVQAFDQAASVAWTKPPYVVPFLPPGSYQVHLTSDFGKLRSASPVHAFKSGMVTRIRLAWQ